MHDFSEEIHLPYELLAVSSHHLELCCFYYPYLLCFVWIDKKCWDLVPYSLLMSGYGIPLSSISFLILDRWLCLPYSSRSCFFSPTNLRPCTVDRLWSSSHSKFSLTQVAMQISDYCRYLWGYLTEVDACCFWCCQCHSCNSTRAYNLFGHLTLARTCRPLVLLMWQYIYFSGCWLIFLVHVCMRLLCYGFATYLLISMFLKILI